MNLNTLTRHNLIERMLEEEVVKWDFANFFLGDFIGSGISRAVFEYKLDPSKVVKIDMSRYNANVLEWNLWQRVEFVEDVARWFAPCYQMSGCGRVLLQAKCTEVKKWPDKIPHFLTDLKKQNFGWYKGRVVALDYASHMMMEKGMKLKMVSAKFWEDHS